jgi:propionyl-CoA carboxylase beta chain
LGGGKIELQKTTPKKKLTPESELTIWWTRAFEEIGILVTHRTTDFGMKKELYYGDGVNTDTEPLTED